MEINRYDYFENISLEFFLFSNVVGTLMISLLDLSNVSSRII
jgi:hypothetical protein